VTASATVELFVTGTDTGVGKTTVSCALLAAARGRGLVAAGLKPIESGCARADDGSLVPADALALASAAAGEAVLEPPASNLYRFAAPLAPTVAAEREGGRVELGPILAAVERARALAPDLLLVEGAGGLLVPLADDLLIADLAVALAAPLLVVARDSLGTINHTLLTIESATRRGLRVAGVVLSSTDGQTEPDEAERNADEISFRARVPVLGRLPYLPDVSDEVRAAAAEAHIELDRLLDT
jgi:dethiobiotin synthetase